MKGRNSSLCLSAKNSGAHAWLFASRLIYLGGCASLPENFEQIPSQGYPDSEQTTLCSLIAETSPEDKSLSGVELLSEPGEAFSTRFAIAGFA